MRQVLVAVDGTAQDARSGTLVSRLPRKFAATTHYFPGVGSRASGEGQLQRALRCLTGVGVGAQARDVENVLRGHDGRGVYAISWSRGYLPLLRAIQRSEAPVRGLVLLDPVSSLGVPGEGLRVLDRRWPLEIPENVQEWVQLVAEDEDDFGFHPTRFPSDKRGCAFRSAGDHRAVGFGTHGVESYVENWFVQRGLVPLPSLAPDVTPPLLRPRVQGLRPWR